MVTSAGMSPLAQVAAVCAAVVHVAAFYMESIAFRRPEVYKRFGVRSEQDAEAIRPMAFNQGFYNLFLAAGIAGGLLLIAQGRVQEGRAIVLFVCACMVGAAAVLLATSRRFVRAALIQGIPPLTAIVSSVL